MTIPLRPQPGIYAEADNSKAVSTSSAIPKRLLILGGLLPTGTATAGVPVRVLSGNDAAKKFGLGSILSRMVRASFKAAPNLEIWGSHGLSAATCRAVSRCGYIARNFVARLHDGDRVCADKHISI